MTLYSIDILTVWEALGGGALRATRGQAFWRKGEGFTVSLDRDKGAWYDFSVRRGGGILSLVMLVRECTRAEALEWLENYCELDPLYSFSTEERRRRTVALAEARELLAWRNRLLVRLKREQDRCFPLYHEGVRWLEHGADSALAGAVARACQILEERALRAQGGLQLLGKSAWSDLLHVFRSQKARSTDG